MVFYKHLNLGILISNCNPLAVAALYTVLLAVCMDEKRWEEFWF